MPLDTTKIPALEEELRQAKGTKPGGQASRPERVAAIEQELKTLRKEAERLFTVARDALGFGKEKKTKVETKVEKAKEAAAADVPETADAAPAPDNADEKAADPVAENVDAASAPENASA